MQSSHSDTIVALATPQGIGAIGVIRLSGEKAISICESVFATKNLKKKNLENKASHTIHFGVIHDKEVIIDEVLVSLFKGPHSYTGENTVEISCHGSKFIQQQLIQLFIKLGARMANQGEFTLRAFLNGKLDLSQAEVFTDFIEYNDLGLPLAYAFANQIITKTDKLTKFIDESFDLLLLGLEVEEDTGFESLDELLGFSDNIGLEDM